MRVCAVSIFCCCGINHHRSSSLERHPFVTSQVPGVASGACAQGGGFSAQVSAGAGAPSDWGLFRAAGLVGSVSSTSYDWAACSFPMFSLGATLSPGGCLLSSRATPGPTVWELASAASPGGSLGCDGASPDAA